MPRPLPADMRLGIVEPREAVAAFTRRRLLQPSYAWQDVWQQEHARAFAVAGVTRLQVLKAFYDELEPAIAQGRSWADFQEAMKARLVAAGFWGDVKVRDPATGEERTTRFDQRRLQLIYDVNTRQSFAAGRWARIERTKARFPFVMYRTMRDERVRASHRPWDGVTLPVDHPWWSTHYPPCGWRCRCTAFGLDAKGVERYRRAGLPVKTEAPPVQFVSLINRRSGEVVHVPRGIDPGFGYNPGKVDGDVSAHVAGASTLLDQALEKVPHGAAVEFVRSAIASPEFAAFYADPAGAEMPVGVLTDSQAQRIGATGHLVKLTGAQAQRQRLRSPELAAADYGWVQRALSEGAAVPDGASAIAFVLEVDGWVVLARVTQVGRTVTLRSLRRLSADAARADADVQRLLRKARAGQ